MDVLTKGWRFDTACDTVGRLYGQLLARNSDAGGFAYAVERLTSGSMTVRDLVREFCTSEEFREKFLMNQPPNELAAQIVTRLERNARPSPAAVKRVAVRLLEGDWRQVFREVIDGAGYRQAFGDDRVPRWIG